MHFLYAFQRVILLSDRIEGSAFSDYLRLLKIGTIINLKWVSLGENFIAQG